MTHHGEPGEESSAERPARRILSRAVLVPALVVYAVMITIAADPLGSSAIDAALGRSVSTLVLTSDVPFSHFVIIYDDGEEMWLLGDRYSSTPLSRQVVERLWTYSSTPRITLSWRGPAGEQSFAAEIPLPRQRRRCLLEMHLGADGTPAPPRSAGAPSGIHVQCI